LSGPRIALIGDGRMGRAVAQLAAERGWPVVATIRSANNAGGRGLTREALGGADVAIEFTTPGAAPANVRAALAAGCPIVVGTTGWDEAMPDVIAEARRVSGALFVAANFSIGVAMFARLAERAGELLRGAEGFDAQLIETHHAAKRDAPSGTAKMLQRALAAPLGRDVPITSVRTGSVPGTHELIFDAAFEQITLAHQARDRRVFAEGALVAARWLVGRRGVFGMSDLLTGDRSDR
jgi:4-hydroxy-tetrahydrodipicolinate reductase